MSTRSQDPRKSLIKAGIAVAVVLSLTVLSYAMKKWFKVDGDAPWRLALQQAGAWGPLLFLGIGALLVGIGLPRTIYSGMAGIAFGAKYGIVYSQIGSIIGSMACFYLCRTIGRNWVAHRFGKRIQKLEQRVRKQGFTIFLIIRLFPVGNNFITNCLAAITPVTSSSFFSASFLGFLPVTIVFALLGSSVMKTNHYQLITGIALLLFMAIILPILYRRSHLAESVTQELEEAEETLEG